MCKYGWRNGRRNFQNIDSKLGWNKYTKIPPNRYFDTTFLQAIL